MVHQITQRFINLGFVDHYGEAHVRNEEFSTKFRHEQQVLHLTHQGRAIPHQEPPALDAAQYKEGQGTKLF